MFWDFKKSIERRRIVCVRKSKTGFADAYVNYSNFIGIVDGYTEGLCYMIENEKAYNRKQSRGDLGVRVQTSGMHSDITADTAISNVMTKDAIIACDFSGDVLEGADRGEEFQRDAYTLRSMRTDFALFNRQLGILSGNELRIFNAFKWELYALCNDK